MGDHELMHAAHPAMYNSNNGGAGAVSNGAGAMWWNTVPAAACSTEQLADGFGGTWQSALAGSGYDVVAAADGGKAKSCAAAATPASSESPGNNSSITFQEPTGCCLNDPAAAAGFTDWNHTYMSNGTGAGNNLHGFLQVGHVQDNNMSAARADHSMNASSLMSNNLDLALQGSGSHQEQQLLSGLGQQAELLLSPTSPYGFHSSSLLRSLMDNQPTAKPGIQQQQQQYNQYGQQQQMVHGGQISSQAAAGAGRGALQFTNDAAFWNNNPSAAAGFGVMMAAPAADQASMRAVKQSSPAPPRAANLALKTVLEGVGDSSSITTSRKKASGEPAFKKPRMETPSPLPTFKVRKEKLGDRITALQQLVSPFGKTDTASVLHETIEYVKFLHDQVGVLSAPYLKNGNHHHHQVPQYLKSSSASPDKPSKDGSEVSLKGRGLCLVPISSTFAVASEVPVDFWTPFGAGFR